MIKGYSPERFINLCSSRNILIWNLRKVEEGYEFNISINGFLQLKPITKKTKTRPIIIKKNGFPFHFQKNKKRKGFFIGIILFFLLIYILSLYIWNISISGQSKHTQESMVKYLKSIDVYSGIKKSKLDCQKIENEIRKEFVDIGWVSAEIRGTRLLIKITETNMPVPYEKSVEPSHIIASQNGIIQSIVTRKGIPMVKEGDVVKKGDILVSGVIEIMGDFEELISKEIVVADGDVMLKTYYNYEKEFKRSYIDKIYTKDKFSIYGLSILGKQMFFYNPLKKMKSFDKYDIIVNDNSLRLNNSFYLPVTGFHKQYVEYTEKKKKYSKNQAIDKAREELVQYIEKLKEKGVSIIENNVKILLDNNKCTSTGKIVVQVPENSYRKIEESEWRIQQTDEPNGNDN
jgi:similar to stage IV sporulation protein